MKIEQIDEKLSCINRGLACLGVHECIFYHEGEVGSGFFSCEVDDNFKPIEGTYVRPLHFITHAEESFAFPTRVGVVALSLKTCDVIYLRNNMKLRVNLSGKLAPLTVGSKKTFLMGEVVDGQEIISQIIEEDDLVTFKSLQKHIERSLTICDLNCLDKEFPSEQILAAYQESVSYPIHQANQVTLKGKPGERKSFSLKTQSETNSLTSASFPDFYSDQDAKRIMTGILGNEKAYSLRREVTDAISLYIPSFMEYVKPVPAFHQADIYSPKTIAIPDSVAIGKVISDFYTKGTHQPKAMDEKKNVK